MRFQRTAAVLAAVVLVWAVGPLVLILVLGSLAVPRVRRWWRPSMTRRQVLRGAAVGVLGAALVGGVVVLVPDGYLPIPPGAGALVTPKYVGRPATPDPIDLSAPQSPARTSADRSGTAPGPLGESPVVDTAWLGLDQCGRISFDAEARLVTVCGRPGDRTLRVLDAETMRPRAAMGLPESSCSDAPFFLGPDDRAVLSHAGPEILVVETRDGRGEPDLTVETSYDLSPRVPASDCVVALAPDWAGRIWWASEAGRVGFVEPESGEVRGLEVGEQIANGLTVGRDGGVYAVSAEALYRLGIDPAGRPEIRWRTIYDPGTERKPGQLSPGSGTTPTLLPDGLVAITDNAEPRMHVQFYRVADGVLECQTGVFEEGGSATAGSLVAVGPGSVVVANTHGYTGLRRTVLGRATAGGFVRVEAVDGRCETAWTNEEIAPSGAAVVSGASGLVYAYTKRRSYLGADAWYLTAMDARSGQRIWSRRTGLGVLFDNHHSPVTLGPDGSAYAATVAGLVRVRDRRLG